MGANDDERGFAELFESAYREESMAVSCDSCESEPSTSIHLLSLGDTAHSYKLTRSFSTGPELSVLQAMEPVGEPDEAWQRLYQRITQQRNTSGVPGGYSSEMLKRGNEENIQVFMGGAPDAGSLQQMASQFGGQRKSEEITSKLRGAATSAEALTC